MDVPPADWIVLRLSLQSSRRRLLTASLMVRRWQGNSRPTRCNRRKRSALRGRCAAQPETGFFLDQRDNRAQVETLAGRRKTLNVLPTPVAFRSMRRAAPLVANLDTAAARAGCGWRNFALNDDAAAVAARHAVSWPRMRLPGWQVGREGRRFDLVVVDPPAFAQQQAAIRALLAYERLTRLALGVLRSGGTLVTASCSSRVSEQEFFAAVRRGAASVARPLHEFAHTGHAGPSGALCGRSVSQVFVCRGGR